MIDFKKQYIWNISFGMIVQYESVVHVMIFFGFNRDLKEIYSQLQEKT
jgi:hypothetical protein